VQPCAWASAWPSSSAVPARSAGGYHRRLRRGSGAGRFGRRDVEVGFVGQLLESKLERRAGARRGHRIGEVERFLHGYRTITDGAAVDAELRDQDLAAIPRDEKPGEQGKPGSTADKKTKTKAKKKG